MAAGGLAGLANMPGCNIQSLGYKVEGSENRPFACYLRESPLVQVVEDNLKKRAVRMLGNKASLACRIDLSGSGSEMGK